MVAIGHVDVLKMTSWSSSQVYLKSAVDLRGHILKQTTICTRSQLFPIHLMSWIVEGSRSTRREPTQTHGAQANSTPLREVQGPGAHTSSLKQALLFKKYANQEVVASLLPAERGESVGGV